MTDLPMIIPDLPVGSVPEEAGAHGTFRCLGCGQVKFLVSTFLDETVCLPCYREWRKQEDIRDQQPTWDLRMLVNCLAQEGKTLEQWIAAHQQEAARVWAKHRKKGR